MLTRHTSRELSEWIAYARIEPFGFHRTDVGFATIACVVANANRDPKKKSQPFTIDDFIPKYEEVEEATPEESVSWITAMNQALGGEDKRPKGDG